MYCKPGYQVIKCKILEKDSGLYTSLVVIDLTTNQFLILTVFPNWQGEIPAKGDIGYIELEYCEAGITKYYDKVNNNSNNLYKNTYFVFRQFVKETPTNKEDVIL